MVTDGTASALDRRLALAQSSSRLPSLVAALARSGRIIWSGSAGEVEGTAPGETTQYRCGSISKTFVAVSVMRLRDEGLLELNDPIGTHLPELTGFQASVAQLLSHTSGLRAETSGPWWERTPGRPFSDLVASSIRPEDVLARPGRRFHYSNVGYAVLGELVARLRGARWDEVVAHDLLEPLGMARTTTRPVPPHASGHGVHPHADVWLPEPEHDAASMAPAGQLWTTVGDLATWSGVLAGDRPELLAVETAAEMREPLALTDMPDQAWTTAYGLGLQVFNRGGDRSFGHGGSMPGFLALLRVDPGQGSALVVMTNATSGLDPALEGDLVGILAEREATSPPAWAPAPGGLRPGVLELTGTWYWGTSGFLLSVSREGDLELSALALGRESAFRRTGEDCFVGLFGYYTGETLRVGRRADGSLSHLDIGSFILTRTPYDPSAPVPGGVSETGWIARQASREG